MKRARLAILLACAWVASAELQFFAQKREVVLWRMRQAETENGKRYQVLSDLFEEVGCGPHITLQPVKGVKSPNIICTLPGRSESVIVFGAHYDGTEWSQAASDNWSGAALLPTLYADAKMATRKHTFVFVGFTGRSDGMLGSERYAAEFSRNVRPMVNLDTLGLSDTKIWVSHSDAELVNLLAEVAASIGAPLDPMEIRQEADWNSQSFRNRSIPSIDIHSVTQETAVLPRSTWDDLRIIDGEKYYRTYQLLSAYLAFLDEKLQ